MFLNFLNHCLFKFSTFHLLQPFLFHLNFLINFILLYFHLSPLFLPSGSWQKKSILSLSLSLSSVLFLYFGGFFSYFNHFFLLMMLFVIIDLIVTSHLFLFLANLYWLLCIFYVFWYSNWQFPITCSFSLFHCFDFI